MTARFAGTCRICGGPIAKGQEIIWAKGYGARHHGCTRETQAARQDMSRSQAAWDSDRAEGYCPDPGEVAADNFAAAQGYAAESYRERSCGW